MRINTALFREVFLIFTYYVKYAKLKVINKTGDTKNARDKRKSI